MSYTFEMRSKLLPIFLLFAAVSGSCSFATNPLPSSKPTGGTAPSSSVPADRFSASATSPVSVQLSWPAAAGVDKYLLDVRIGDDEYIPLAELAADQTSFEDMPVPRETQLVYRLRTVKGSETSAGETVTVTTPPAKPNPITIKATAYQPTHWVPPTVDPNNPNIDPSKFYPPGFDPNNPQAFDPSSIMTQPGVSEMIGPQGGSVTVTSPDGVIYTLQVPEGAVEASIIITLTPIQTIAGLPSNGSMLAGVKIEPERFILNAPATLSITLPQNTPPIPAGMHDVGFAYRGDGTEFTLIPKALPSAQSSTNPHPGLQLIDLPQGTAHADSTAITLKMGTDLLNLGIARWPPEIVDIAKGNTPTDPGDVVPLDMTVIQIKDETDEPAPLSKLGIDPSLVEHAKSALDKANTADSWPNLTAALDDFRKYMEDGGNISAMDKVNTGILDLLLKKASALLDNNQGRCFATDDNQAQELVERLTAPKDAFSRLLSQRYQAKYKAAYDKLMAEDLVKKCKVYLKITSTISYQLGGLTISAAVKATIPLTWKFDRYSRASSLSGTGDLVYTLFDLHGGGCSNGKLNTNQGSTFTVNRLVPIYDAGKLTNFRLADYVMAGKQTRVSASCPTGVASARSLGGTGGDIWGGLYITSHMPDDMVLDLWTKVSKSANPTGAVAEKEYRWSKTPSLGDGNVTEQTTFTILVGK